MGQLIQTNARIDRLDERWAQVERDLRGVREAVERLADYEELKERVSRLEQRVETLQAPRSPSP